MLSRRSFGRRNRISRFRELEITFSYSSSPKKAKNRRFRKKSASRGPAVSPTHPGLYLQMLFRRSFGRRNRTSRFRELEITFNYSSSPKKAKRRRFLKKSADRL